MHRCMRSRASIIRVRLKERGRNMANRKRKEIVQNIVDTVRMMWRLDRTVVVTMLANALIEAAIPFVGIYLSAYVLDGLGTGQQKEGLLNVVFMAVGLVFMLTVLSSYLKKSMRYT